MAAAGKKSGKGGEAKAADVAGAAQVLEQYFSGEVAEANALTQLAHLHKQDARSVLAALSEKANMVVSNGDCGAVAAVAGTMLVNAAAFLDERAGKAAAGGSSGQAAPGAAVRRALLDHVLLLSGGPGKAAKDTGVRGQGCAVLAALAPAAPDHAGLKEKLVELSLDRVPSIRQRALGGLAALSPSIDVDQALIARTSDAFAAVRVAALRAMRVTPLTAPVLLKRIDDVEACVRKELMDTLARQPASMQAFGPAALARLCAALSDRSSGVRTAAGLVADAWHKHCGGALQLLSRCDVTGDEALGDTVASVLAARFPDEGLAASRHLFGRSAKRSDGADKEGFFAALFARHAVASMDEGQRDEVVDIPVVLRRANEALGSAHSHPHGTFLLRQCLHVVVLADICDEASRRRAEELAEAVLSRAPLDFVAGVGAATGGGRGPGYGAADLAVVILRRCRGLGRGFRQGRGKLQALEVECSTRIVLLVSDLCQPLQQNGDDEGMNGDEGGDRAMRLSIRLQELNDGVAERLQRKATLAAEKKKAIADEEFIQAQKIKEANKKNEAELAALQKERAAVKGERDSHLLRVLGILSALLRWSNSDVRKDPALFGTLDQILRPVVSLPALGGDLEVAAISAICLFCTRDGPTARGHWALLLELLRSLRETPAAKHSAAERRHLCARAAVAARALTDCALLLGGQGGLDRDEVMSAACAVASVPFHARHIAVEPMCTWLLGAGHVFFEEHLCEPVHEVQWALGWLLVEAFKQTGGSLLDDEDEGADRPARGQAATAGTQVVAAAKAGRARGLSWVKRPGTEGEAVAADREANKADAKGGADEEAEDENEDSPEGAALASRLTQFFSLLPKLPGRHAAPMLSLAVESIAESGLWRRAVLLPRMVGGKPRWLRGFSWPQLFTFAHERLPSEMRFRLWRCSLQLCVAFPALAPLAEVQFALVAVAKDAPPGAAELLREALALGADAKALAPVQARLLPDLEEAPKPVEGKLLLPREEAEKAERERRETLVSLGIDVEAWAPAEVATPEAVPPHHRMRAARKGEGKVAGNAASRKRAAAAAASAENLAPEGLPSPSNSPPNVQPQLPLEEGAKRRKVCKTKDPAFARLPLRDVR